MSSDRTLRILVVCTANVCRSPVAERLLERHLSAVGLSAAVSSAGTRGGRLEPHRDTVRAAHELGIDIRTHQSRLLDQRVIADDGADLVVTMEREHLREVVSLEPSAWPRTFTLKEFGRRVAGGPPVVGSHSAWLTSVGAGRRAADMMTPSPDDDLADPYGAPLEAHRVMVEEVDHRTSEIARFLSGLT